MKQIKQLSELDIGLDFQRRKSGWISDTVIFPLLLMNLVILAGDCAPWTWQIFLKERKGESDRGIVKIVTLQIARNNKILTKSNCAPRTWQIFLKGDCERPSQSQKCYFTNSKKQKAKITK